LVAVTAEGALGTVPTVFCAEAAVGALLPALFLAVTVTVYAIPSVRLVMSQVAEGVATAPVQVPPPTAGGTATAVAV
jgi:hypothetical protein